jgi:peptidyl-tRNA hydrolase
MTPVLYNEHDGVDAERVRGSQADPLIMYLVVPRRPEASGGELLSHAAIATLGCVERYQADPAWSEPFAEWRRSSFRKVCLRARPAELERARALDHAQSGDVLCLPPRRRSAAEPELSKLQAHIGGALHRAEHDDSPPDPGAMVMLISEDLEMTLGKACAQVAHAVLIASDLHPPAAITSWRDVASPVAVRLVDREPFERAKQELTVAAVRDAGLTQVAPGTETVLATQPGSPLPGWLIDEIDPIG